MKNGLSKWLLLITFTLSISCLASASEAYRCKWVPAHWQNGRYIPAHQVCWHDYNGRYYHHCWWRNGYKYCR